MQQASKKKNQRGCFEENSERQTMDQKRKLQAPSCKSEDRVLSQKKTINQQENQRDRRIKHWQKPKTINHIMQKYQSPDHNQAPARTTSDR
jgi:hypothetical protein